MPRLLRSCFLPLLLASTFLPALSQTAQNSCPAPPAILSSTQPNIFSEQQEQWLGDAMADMLEREYRPVHDPAENEYLAHITKHLLAALPPTTIQFRVILVDSPDVNGFSLAGGRVYLTRKLVANARNEDEVATVIAHEIGHILSHQFAVEFTANLKRLLNVTSVSDKADIYAKFQRLMDASMLDKHPGKGGDSDQGQDEADTVAVYAAAAAGYHPQAYSEFWDRMFFVDGKVGGALSDFFHTTKPESKRLRSILKLVNALPAGCGASKSTTTPEFDKWHSLVVANQPATFDLDFKPVSEVTLNPPLRMDLERLRFSRDGKYVLAQDESSITVLSRDPWKQLFRFDAEKARPAEFTPDSQRLVFHTAGLHTEEWSLSAQKLLASHEPLARNECLQTKLSPDGRTLFCISLREGNYALDLTMLDVATGAVLFQKKEFFFPNFSFFFALALNRYTSSPADVLQSSFSADGNILLIGPADAKLAFDLRTRTLIPVKGGLKGTINGPYAFLGDDRVIGSNFTSPADSGIFTFPDGRRLQNTSFALSTMQSVTNGNYVLTSSIKDYAVALADITQAKFVFESRVTALDVWNGWVTHESADGDLLLEKLGDKDLGIFKTSLPLSPLGPLRLTAVSNDGKYLVLSTHTRAGVWDLRTGKRLVISRPFNSATFAPDDTLYADVSAFGKEQRGIWKFSFSPASAAPVSYKQDLKDDVPTFFSSGVLQEWKPVKKSAEFVAHNIVDDSVLWSRTFVSGEPGHTYNLLAGQTILSMPIKTDNAKEILKTTPDLATRVAQFKNKDTVRLIQVIETATGKVLNQLAIEVPLTYQGVQGINVIADKLYLSSEDNRTMVYDLATGNQLRQFFGYVIALDSTSSRICAINRRDEATVYDLAGNQVASFRTGSPVRFALFQQAGSRLTLLTADQKVRTMEIANSSQ